MDGPTGMACGAQAPMRLLSGALRYRYDRESAARCRFVGTERADDHSGRGCGSPAPLRTCWTAASAAMARAWAWLWPPRASRSGWRPCWPSPSPGPARPRGQDRRGTPGHRRGAAKSQPPGRERAPGGAPPRDSRQPARDGEGRRRDQVVKPATVYSAGGLFDGPTDAPAPGSAGPGRLPRLLRRGCGPGGLRNEPGTWWPARHGPAGGQHRTAARIPAGNVSLAGACSRRGSWLEISWTVRSSAPAARIPRADPARRGLPAEVRQSGSQREPTARVHASRHPGTALRPRPSPLRAARTVRAAATRAAATGPAAVRGRAVRAATG